MLMRRDEMRVDKGRLVAKTVLGSQGSQCFYVPATPLTSSHKCSDGKKC